MSCIVSLAPAREEVKRRPRKPSKRAETAARKAVDEEVRAEEWLLKGVLAGQPLASIIARPLAAFVSPLRGPAGWSFALPTLRPDFGAPPPWVPDRIRQDVSGFPSAGAHIIPREQVAGWTSALGRDPNALLEHVKRHLSTLGVSAAEIRAWQGAIQGKSRWPIPRRDPLDDNVDTSKPIENCAAFGSFLDGILRVGAHSQKASCDVRLRFWSILMVDAFDYQSLSELVAMRDEALCLATLRQRMEGHYAAYLDNQLWERSGSNKPDSSGEASEDTTVVIADENEFVADYLRRALKARVDERHENGQTIVVATGTVAREMQALLDELRAGLRQSGIHRKVAATLGIGEKEARTILTQIEDDELRRDQLDDLSALLSRATSGGVQILMRFVD